MDYLVCDVTDSDFNYYQFKNNGSGFKKFVNLLDQRSYCVIEARGSYHSQSAYYLLKSGVKGFVENAKSVKRFIEMKLSKLKIDKSDSKLICDDTQKVELKLWKGNSKDEKECLQITRVDTVYKKQGTRLKTNDMAKPFWLSQVKPL